jgi:hypothetical protein
MRIKNQSLPIDCQIFGNGVPGRCQNMIFWQSAGFQGVKFPSAWMPIHKVITNRFLFFDDP